MRSSADLYMAELKPAMEQCNQLVDGFSTDAGRFRCGIVSLDGGRGEVCDETVSSSFAPP